MSNGFCQMRCDKTVCWHVVLSHNRCEKNVWKNGNDFVDKIILWLPNRILSRCASCCGYWSFRLNLHLCDHKTAKIRQGQAWHKSILCNSLTAVAIMTVINAPSRMKDGKRRSQLRRRAELTAKLVEVCLDFPPGVEEHSALFCADGNHAVLVYGDTRYLSIELRHRHALQNRDTDTI